LHTSHAGIMLHLAVFGQQLRMSFVPPVRFECAVRGGGSTLALVRQNIVEAL